jgi:uncharacterized membrane protein YdfJ with MMPL/SSD domain
MAVQVNPGQELKHEGIVYKAGEIIHNLAEDLKNELVRLGVIKDLEQDANQVEDQIQQDAHTVAGQVQTDEELVRGQVEDQIHAHAKDDVQAALDTLAAPGEPVNQGAPAQPTAEEISKTADSVS